MRNQLCNKYLFLFFSIPINQLSIPNPIVIVSMASTFADLSEIHTETE